MKIVILDPFLVNDPILYPQEIQENQTLLFFQGAWCKKWERGQKWFNKVKHATIKVINMALS